MIKQDFISTHTQTSIKAENYNKNCNWKNILKKTKKQTLQISPRKNRNEDLAVDVDFGMKMIFQLPLNNDAHIFRNSWFKFTLSGISKQCANAIKHNLIRECGIEIGGQRIDRHFSLSQPILELFYQTHTIVSKNEKAFKNHLIPCSKYGQETEKTIYNKN